MDLKSIKIYNDRDFPPYLPKLNAIYDDLFTGGKGLRSRLIGLMSKHLVLDDKRTLLLAQTIEFIHNASLLHDDLVDRSHLRRSKPTAWLKYSPEYAVLAGDYLLARVMVNLSSHGNLKLVNYTSEVISDLLEGEWIQDSLVGDFDVRLEELDRVHNLKTASLFKWCLRAPFYAAENFDESLHAMLEEMGTLLGQLFQRSDDLLDYNIRNDENKAILGDLKSKYVNSFAAFLIQDLPADKKLEFAKSTCMMDVYRTIGEKEFFAKVEEFDKINSGMIGLFHHHLSSLQKYLKPEQMPLTSELSRICKALYWRRVQ